MADSDSPYRVPLSELCPQLPPLDPPPSPPRDPDWQDVGNYSYYVGVGWCVEAWRYHPGRGWSDDGGQTITEFSYHGRPRQ